MSTTINVKEEFDKIKNDIPEDELFELIERYGDAKIKDDFSFRLEKMKRTWNTRVREWLSEAMYEDLTYDLPTRETRRDYLSPAWDGPPFDEDFPDYEETKKMVNLLCKDKDPNISSIAKDIKREYGL